MASTDLALLDRDPGDSLDGSQDYYKKWLMAGYSNIESKFGVCASSRTSPNLRGFPRPCIRLCKKNYLVPACDDAHCSVLTPQSVCESWRSPPGGSFTFTYCAKYPVLVLIFTPSCLAFITTLRNVPSLVLFVG
jgi:hypothetical protein